MVQETVHLASTMQPLFAGAARIEFDSVILKDTCYRLARNSAGGMPCRIAWEAGPKWL